MKQSERTSVHDCLGLETHKKRAKLKDMIQMAKESDVDVLSKQECQLVMFHSMIQEIIFLCNNIE